MNFKNILVEVILLSLTSLSQEYQVSDFQGKFFKFNNPTSGVYEVDVGLGSFSGFLVAYGDFNGDKSIDIVTLDINRKYVQIYYWGSNSFTLSNVCQNDQPCCPYNGCIQGTILGDYNYDGLLDIMLVVSQDTFTNYIFLQSGSSNGYPAFLLPQSFQSTNYPFVGDFQGNHQTTVLVMQNAQRVIVDTQQPLSSQAVGFSTFTNTTADCLAGGQYDTIITSQFSSPNFNSFIDLNSDCRADLFIFSTTSEGQQIEYWYTMPDQASTQARYCLKYVEMVKKGLTILTLNFADLNYDGLVDMISVVTDGTQQSLVINYNTYAYVYTDANLCQNQKGTDVWDINTKYPFQNVLITNDTYRIVTPLQDQNGQLYQLFDYSSPQIQGLFAPFIRFGDFKSTGFPGGFVTLVTTSSQSTSTTSKTYYLNNAACSNCDLLSGDLKNKRSLYIDTSPSSSEYPGLSQVSTSPSINGAFYDYGENGRLDFLINTFDLATNTTSIVAFYNYLSIDAFYLKSLGVNGQCQANQDSELNCLGALYYGTTYKFMVTDINGQYNPALGFQLYQSAYSPLQLPYSYVGLGRTNNYVEDFNAGIPLLSGAVNVWTPIIPNSQLIISPYSDDVKNWTLSIFIEPTDAILVVVIVTVIVLVLLGGIIIWKHIKEKEEDKKNQETFFQMFR